MTAPITLTRLLRRPAFAHTLAALAPGGFGIDGDVLRLTDHDEQRAPIEVEGERIAEVVAPDAVTVARLLSSMASIETERRRLADEVLNLYREINLLYDLADRLAGAMSRGELGDRMLMEAMRLVPADAAEVILDDETVALRGADRSTTDPDPETTMVVPITLDATMRGTLVLSRRAGSFTTAEYKRVSAVAGHGALLLGGVCEAERRRANAARRESRLRAQIERLQVELDETRPGPDEQPGHVSELWARFEALRAGMPPAR